MSGGWYLEETWYSAQRMQEVYLGGQWTVPAGKVEIYLGGTWFELWDFGVTPDPTPESFSALHDDTPCPTREVDLSWVNPAGKTTTTLRLEHSTDEATWTLLSAGLAGGTTSYTHGSNGPSAGDNFYRLRYTDETEWAEAYAFVLCPI